MDVDKLPAEKEPARSDPFSALHREIDRVFSDFSHGFPFLGRPLSGKLTPSMDVKDTGKALEVRLELPGMSEKDFEVTITDDRLTVSGEKKSEKKSEADDYKVMERSFGKFTRSVMLPFPPDPGKVEASFDNGLLTLTMPKPPEQVARATKISVKAKKS